MNWPSRRMRTVDAHRHPQRPREFRAALSHARALVGGIAALAALCAWTTPARAEASRFTFAVIADTMRSPADEASTQRLLDAIGRERAVRFIVYDGNLKGPKEVCRDTLYERRYALLENSRLPLFFIPGEHDWVDCGTAEAGGFDPVERLDLLRQTLFADSTSMGQNPIALTRESEVSRFRPFRENVRWVMSESANEKANDRTADQARDIVFVGLNAPGPNNHYLTAGGRNGEFEDRVIANAFWLEHAGEYAKRRDARAIVVFIEGDFDPERYKRPERFAWLHFARSTRRDGFLELKRSLVKLAQTFHGPVVVIHADDERVAGGFVIDQPLRNDKGMAVTNLTRIGLAPRDRFNQWIQIEADFGRKTPFRVSVHDVPKQIPLPTTPPLQSHDESGASMSGSPDMPNVPGFGPASELPPLLPQAPGAPGTPGGPQLDQEGSEYEPAISMPPGSILPASPSVPAPSPASAPATSPRVPPGTPSGAPG